MAKSWQLKTFHSEILNDHEQLKKEQAAYENIPLIRKIDNTMVHQNYQQIKLDIQDIINSEIERILDSGQSYLIIKKK